ncbi:mCG148221 [Mus musculus]|jgi:hypothetical protein|uniref:Uncharacterized protein n=1 Tax=Mus musculus TaxID=10090 RepID=Q8BNN2_MOUSE|nr:mCG148221 [Mus musculus]BAC38168.1 unnamed protein product [Mus musculus]
MRSLRSRPVAVAGTATVLQPTQPRSTVTRTHLRQAKGRTVSWVRARPGGTTLPPGVSSPVPHGGLPRPPPHAQPCRSERSATGPEAGILMAEACTAAALCRSPQKGRGRRRCGGGASPSAPRARGCKGPCRRRPQACAALGPLSAEQPFRVATPS